MTSGRAAKVATVAAAVVLVAYVVDVVAGDLSPGAATFGRAAVIVAAVVCAGIVYQSWSTSRQHTPSDHAAVAAALLGGALASSSAFSAPDGRLFGNSISAAAGVAGLILAIIGSRSAPLRTRGPR